MSSSPKLRKTRLIARAEDSSTPTLKAKPKIEPSSASCELSTALCSDGGPFPFHPHPLPDACLAARNSLAKLHGYDEEKGASNTGLEQAEPRPAMKDGNHLQQTVLDSLVRTILSQNTTDKTSLRAFHKLKGAFPTWEEVLEAPAAEIESAIREGGLAEIKCARIKEILGTISQESFARGPPPPSSSSQPPLAGALSLEHLRALPTDEVKAALRRFKGVGPKTISCVLMFTLGRAEFPVDTHVWRIAKKLGWVPDHAGREQTYEHLNRRIPDALKYDLHVLLVDHGKRCVSCLGKNGRCSKDAHGPCPLQRASPQSKKPLAAPSDGMEKLLSKKKQKR